ncbi:MAG: TonB-dependent receptor [Alphaproteobacteria bacterium]|nr:TonB-dependent receptor [Alphaproteobacteria bacterium]MBU1512482.1 TonB-dependent receptor [Alphaproteobacteria bacterium]MBU2096594.1 TonB-dependent receptor [Alphaproteobacteria bacterium]MBU2151588.1 TonB-dependent receptor [Alphaproteobacteria bacterium]MBU2307305.1 TonB-dependent receptor [Alphaproteobacteria bacterium]
MSISLRVAVSRAVLAAAMWPVAGAALAQAPDSAGAQIEEVVVTALRRETTLQNVSQSVAVLNGETQRERGQQRLEDLQTSVPNVSFTNTSNASQLYIRGVGNTFINAGGDPGVAFYQDGAYVSDQRTTNTSMFDVQRVEILRGPQGALYGRNAVGGAVNVISARPAADAEGRVDAVVGKYGRFESEGFFTGPVTDGVAARMSYQVRKLDGYTKNLLGGRLGGPDRFDDQDSYAVRGQLAFDLPSEGRLTLLASWYREDPNGPALTVVSVPGVIYPAEALFGERPTNRPRDIKATVGSTELEVATLNANLVQPVGRNTLTATVNYRDGVQDFLNDCDGVQAEACRYAAHTSSQDYYAEAYLASPGEDRVRWIVGGSYVRFNQSQNVQVPWQTLAAYLAPAAPANVPFFILYDAGGKLDVESFAAYADLRIQLNDAWALLGQARYSETTKRSVDYQSIASFGVNVTGFRNRLKNTHKPFKVGLEGKLAPDVLVYASYATANKDGAINIGSLQTSPVRSEEVQTWEVGEKASFFGRRLQVNGAIFSSRYEDLQITQIIGPIAALANVPKSIVKGAELEVVAQPARGLRLSAGVGYIDGTFDEFINSRTIPGPAPAAPSDLSGNQVPNISKWSVTLDGQYRFSPAAGYQATVGAQYAWRSRVYFNEFNDRDNGQGAGGILNLSASLAPQAGPWRVYGYVTNVFDRTYQVGSTIYSGLLGGEKAVNYAPPRNFAVGVSYAF